MLVSDAHRLLHELHTSITLLMEIALSCSAMPPLIFFCGLGRTFFFTIITCSTSTLPSSGMTRSTRPCFAFVPSGNHPHLIVAANID